MGTVSKLIKLWTEPVSFVYFSQLKANDRFHSVPFSSWSENKEFLPRHITLFFIVFAGVLVIIDLT